MENIYFETGRLTGDEKESNCFSLFLNFIHTFLYTILPEFLPLLCKYKKKPGLDIGLWSKVTNLMKSGTDISACWTWFSLA